jgi:hypothetical protein
MTDITAQIIRYESGELDEDQAIALFQDLLDTGLVFALQGHYGRTAEALVEAGLISKGGRS